MPVYALAFVLFTTLFGTVFFKVRYDAAHWPCYRTIQVDGKECRVNSVCSRHVPTHDCHDEVTCKFEGPANGGKCAK